MNCERELRAWSSGAVGSQNWREYCSFLVDQAHQVGESGPDALFTRLEAAGLSPSARYYVMERLFGGE